MFSYDRVELIDRAPFPLCLASARRKMCIEGQEPGVTSREILNPSEVTLVA